jgi:GT2 family glycosyltransferase
MANVSLGLAWVADSTVPRRAILRAPRDDERKSAGCPGVGRVMTRGPDEASPGQRPVPPPDVSVVIVSWNVRDLLRDCIASIRRETRRSHEIIVVDNASRDGSADMVRSQFPGVTVIANPDNRGFAAANNQGLAVACGRTVLLLNPDTLVLDGAIDTMLGWLERHPGVGCVGCQVLESETEVQATCFRDPGPLNLLLIETGLHRLLAGRRRGGGPHYAGWDRDDEREVDVVSGMFMLVPRRVMEQVGPLDEAFFVYSEEADWCRRIRDAGHRCVFAPVARIRHREGGGKSTALMKPRMYVQQQKSKLIYVRKHYGFAGAAFARATLTASMLARGAVFRLASLAVPRGDARSLSRLGWAAVRFHLTGREPA